MTKPNLSSLCLIFLSFCSIITCNADASKEHEYNYDEGSPIGPKKWGSLNASFKVCSDGESQSLVDIEAKKAKDQQNDLKRSYKEAHAKLFDKGHHIAVEWDGDAGGIEVNGTTYKLVQCHWHLPAEHTFDGKRFDAEIHFVHSNDKYQLAVVGVLYAIGEPDPFIAKLSESKFKEISDKGNDLGKVSASRITGSKKYFRYRGSLTTPPCSEGVIWTVAETVKSISKEQIETLKGPLEVEFKENARPVQELSGRTVTQFEDKEGTGEDAKDSGAESSSSILRLINGIIMLIQIYILLILF